jgi:hypothetical protein
LLTVSRSFMNVANSVLWRMAIILKANKVNLFVSCVLFIFWYHSPNILDTPRRPCCTYQPRWQMSVENWWNDNWQETLKYSETNLPRCQSVHNKSHMDYLGGGLPPRPWICPPTDIHGTWYGHHLIVCDPNLWPDLNCAHQYQHGSCENVRGGSKNTTT